MCATEEHVKYGGIEISLRNFAANTSLVFTPRPRMNTNLLLTCLFFNFWIFRVRCFRSYDVSEKLL